VAEEAEPIFMSIETIKQGLRIARGSRVWRPSNFRLVTSAVFDRQRNPQAGFSDDEHLLAAAQWIELAQDASADGGVCGRYSLKNGWSSSYPETTGYLIPTLLRLAEELGEARYRERARRAIEFLLSVQLDSGAFPAMEIAENRTKPSIFNSAQIVCGLRAWHKTSGDERVMQAMRRACDWLVGEQDQDGAWRKHLYGDVTYTYMSHAACWIAEAGEYLEHAVYLDSARRHLEWVLSHRDAETGWFDDCGFGTEDHRLRQSVTHTIAYTIWGVLMMSRILGHREGMIAARTAALAVARRLELSRWLPGVLDHRWRSKATYACLTGNAQMALIWLELHRLETDLPLLSAACKAIDLVKRAQLMRGSDGRIRGGVAGSDPVWGDYIWMALPNWAVKFYIDALLEKRSALRRLRVPPAAPAVLPAGSPPMPVPPDRPVGKPRMIRTVLYTSPYATKVSEFVEAWSRFGYRPDAVVIFHEPEQGLRMRLQEKLRDEGLWRPLMRRVSRAWATRAAGSPPDLSATVSPTGQRVADYCRQKGILVVETGSIKAAESLDVVKRLNPSLAIHAGGGILGPAILEIPQLGTLNAHMGILPRYRGMNVSEWSRLAGDPVGCTVHLVNAGIDTGDIIGCHPIPTDTLRSIEELRDKVDKAQIACLGIVVRYTVETGGLPPVHPQQAEDGRQFFTMHAELRSILDRALHEGVAAE
jgi:hypothetical protein